MREEASKFSCNSHFSVMLQRIFVNVGQIYNFMQKKTKNKMIRKSNWKNRHTFKAAFFFSILPVFHLEESYFATVVDRNNSFFYLSGYKVVALSED